MYWFAHLKTITRHKYVVARLCFKIGLYAQGITHDLSKFSYTEFSSGARFYQGYRSPNDREREVRGYSASWLHHKGRNKHHWEYWLDFDQDHHLTGMRMPEKYVAEMFCDRVAASMIYLQDKYTDASPLEYYLARRWYMILHPETQALLEKWLYELKDQGLDKTLKDIRLSLKGGN